MTGKSARQISLTEQPAFQDGASDYADSVDLERPRGDNRASHVAGSHLNRLLALGTLTVCPLFHLPSFRYSFCLCCFGPHNYWRPF
jgi:hypothetical protein